MRVSWLVAGLFACVSVHVVSAQEGQDEKVTVDDARTAFNVFDYNEDGMLSTRELRGAVKELGFPLSRKEVIAFFRAADKDGDGKLSVKEFQSVLKQFNQLETEDDDLGIDADDEYDSA